MKIRTMLGRVHFAQAFVVAICVALFISIIVPAQTYLSNSDMFCFSFGQMMVEALPWFVGLVVSLWLVFVLSGIVIGRFLPFLALAALLCAYLECGVLSVGLPALNAAPLVFLNPFRIIIDTGILAVVFIGFMLTYRWMRAYMHWMALAIVILSLAAVFDVNKKSIDCGAGPLAEGFCSNLDVLMSTRFSSQRNVIVLVLDSTPASLTSNVMRQFPELQEKFRGFTAFENNRAMHEKTLRGLPGLMTGRYLEKDTSADEYMRSAVGEDSFLVPYVNNGYAVYFMADMLPYGYTNVRLGNFSNEGTGLIQTGPVFSRNSKDSPYITLLDTIRFRLTPYAKKALVLSEAVAHASHNRVWRNCSNEEFAYTTVMSNVTELLDRPALQVLLTHGTHGPIWADRDGNPLPAPSYAREAFQEYSVFLLKRVAVVLDRLRDMGLYDKSMIVLAADHGSIELREGDGTKKHGADDCILWVKPFNAREPFAFSSQPTSNCRVADILRASVSQDLSTSVIAERLYEKKRKFRAKFGRAWWSAGRSPYFYEWRYDEEGHVVSCENVGVYRAN